MSGYYIAVDCTTYGDTDFYRQVSAHDREMPVEGFVLGPRELNPLESLPPPGK